MSYSNTIKEVNSLVPNPNVQIETISCDSDDSIPNNPKYAVLLYKNVIKQEESPLDILNKTIGQTLGVAAYFQYIIIIAIHMKS